MDRTVSSASTSDQSGHGSNVNEGVLHIPQSSSLMLELHYQIVLCHIQDPRWVGVLLPCRDAVGLFYSPRRQDKWAKMGFCKY